jgi:D-alanine-D-alanine ligase
MGKPKIRVAVLYGGRSGEHEISLMSAASVIRHLDRERFEVIPVSIDKDGRWRLNDLKLIEGATRLPLFKDAPDVILPPNLPVSSTAALFQVGPSGGGAGAPTPIDVVFPVMHGTFSEDGTIQGLLELANVPYVGCGVLASAVGMDKDMAKRVVRDAGLPVVPWIALKQAGWKKDPAALAKRVAKELGYPAFVKPANAGSSVGVHKVKAAAELEAALRDAFRYDEKVMIEKAVSAREIELSALENPEPGEAPLVSLPGEVIAQHEFYSYEAKYVDENGAKYAIPAELAPAQVQEAQRIAREAFVALETEGMTRVDLFLDKGTGEFYFNEVNTIPGFTSISMYPKMWEASGIGYTELLSRLVDLAIARHVRKSSLVREFHGK